MSEFAHLARALADFRELLERGRRNGVPYTRVADLAMLRVLVRRYPRETRRFLADLEHEQTRANGV